MRTYITLIFILNSFCVLAQTIGFDVQGEVKDTKHAKFAYLSTSSHQTTISSDKVFMVMPIINGNFKFKGTYNLEGKAYQHACVFVDERGNISKEELASKFEQLIWVVDRENQMKHIILENIKLDIAERDQVKSAKIISGGKLTRQLYEWFAALRGENKSLVKFVKKYPDSEMSLDVISEASRGFPPSKKDMLESKWGAPKELYVLLSERLKKSKRGIALREKIYDKK